MIAADVVVVGAGNAGLVAALAAHEAGAHVIVLESASRSERGGNSRFSGGIFRTVHSGLEGIADLLSTNEADRLGPVRVRPYSADDFRTDWMNVSVGLPDRDLVDLVIGKSWETLQWMSKRGVHWELCTGKLFDETLLGPDTCYELPPGGAIRAADEGVGLVQSLFEAVDDAGIEVWYDAPAIDLLTTGSTACGVAVRRRDSTTEVHGSVVLACGGFESNPEMRQRYLGPGWDLVKVRGTRFNMGTMLTKALAAGAQPAGHWGGCHASPIDAYAPPSGDLRLTDKFSRYSYPYAIMVNANGERFIDEGEDQVWLTYAKTGAAIRSQFRNLAFQIFDQKTAHLLEPRYSTGQPVSANTIAELAKGIGVPADTLASTIVSFNAATAPDATERFQPMVNDGVSARPEAQPAKSNWALPLDSPPFIAYPCSCGITFTYGGLKVDTAARVIDTEGRAMPGLFATGEITGEFFYFNYAGGSGLTRGAVLGRVAGANAAREARSRGEGLAVDRT